MSGAVGLVWDLLAKDNASPAFLRVAESADKAAASTARATAGMQASVTKMASVGKKLTHAVTLPILGIGAAAVDQAMKYQKSMTLIQTAGGETAAKASAISKGLLKVATETGTSLTALSEGIYIVAKAGSRKWSANDQLLIMKAAAEGAKAENVDLGTATNALTSVMMSYHLGASKAVATQNELIRGAGLAKTTMQEYAGSLASVVPVASAAGIKFDQIAGAIATLTQHGTSAQEATQELANTIRNLQKPNNVASQAMQQLGLNVVDVMKNLGKRGLTGTIDLITNAITKKLGPSGLVAVDAFKKSQTATADLNVEIAKMPPKLADLSKQFMAGKIGFTDYRKQIRGLSAEQYSLGSNFLTTMGQAMGFNTLLRQGAPAAQTFAGYLNQVMGGATGLNTALQLGGENMAYFKTATDAVGKAALATGSDVLGWNKTQDTLAVKMDKAKASIQVMAVEIGTALIPVVSKIVDWVSKAVNWFENLSGTDKKIVGWSLAAMAALGPVLSIGSKLALVGRGMSTFAVGIGNTFAKIGTDAEGMSTKATVAIKGFTSALAGIGIGFAAGQITKGASTTTKLIGAAGAALTGAAIGFGAGGPLGAVIGGLAGGAADLATSFLHVGSSAKTSGAVAAAALAEQKRAADDLLTTLQSVSGAYDDTTKAQVITQLNDKGVLGIANQAGIYLPTLINTVIGKGGPQAMSTLNVMLENAAASGKITWQQLAKVQSGLGLVSAAAKSAETSYELENKAAGKNILANDQLGTSLKKLAPLFTDTGTALDNLTPAGMHNIEVVKEEAAAIGANAAEQLKHHKSVDAVAASVGNQTLALQANLIKLGLNSTQVADLIVQYAHVPKSVATKLATNAPIVSTLIQDLITKYGKLPSHKSVNVSTNISSVQSQLKSLEKQLDNLHGRTLQVGVTGISVNNLRRLGLVGGNAGGTTNWRGGWTWVGEKGAELMRLPSGTQIMPHEQSMRYAANGGGGGGFTVYQTINPAPGMDEETVGAVSARRMRAAALALGAAS